MKERLNWIVKNAVTMGSILNCADNTGALKLKLIGVMGVSGAKKRNNSAALGDLIRVSVKQGSSKYLKKCFKAVIVRQKNFFMRRTKGAWYYFQDNAAVLVNDDYTPMGSVLKGPMAYEVYKLHPNLKFNSGRMI